MTKQEHIDAMIASMAPIKSTTRVKGWVLILEKKYYLLLSYWAPPLGDTVSVFLSNKKGKKTDEKELLFFKSKDPHEGVRRLVDLIITEEETI